MPREQPVSDTPKYLIGRVTKLTGLSVDVVRVWERRYGAVRPVRSSGGTRLYSDADIRRLIRLRQAVDGGHSISQAARLSEVELDDLIAGAETPAVEIDPYRTVRERFIEAIRDMNVVGADQELARAASLFPTRDLVKQIVAPILDAVGEGWARKEFGVAQEHIASGLVRSMLGSIFRLYSPQENAHTIVLATPSGERHELSLWIAALLATAHGWRAVCIGADVPADEIAFAVRMTSARVLALSLSTTLPGMDQELSLISKLIPLSTRVWIGGRESPKHREQIARSDWLLLRDIEELDARLREVGAARNTVFESN